MHAFTITELIQSTFYNKYAKMVSSSKKCDNYICRVIRRPNIGIPREGERMWKMVVVVTY